MRTSRNFIRMVAVLILLPISMIVTNYQSPAGEACTVLPNSDHCYGIAWWLDSPTNYGSGGTLTSHCLYNADAPKYFTDEEMWNSTDNAKNFQYWVEAGAQYGYNHATRHWFWADNRPNGGGFYIHFPSLSFSLDTPYSIKFEYNPVQGDEWDIYLKGQFIDKSIADPPAGKALEAGTEITNNTTRSVGHISGLYYINTNHYSWSGASTPAPAVSWIHVSLNSDKSTVSWSTPC